MKILRISSSSSSLELHGKHQAETEIIDEDGGVGHGGGAPRLSGVDPQNKSIPGQKFHPTCSRCRRVLGCFPSQPRFDFQKEKTKHCEVNLMHFHLGKKKYVLSKLFSII